jgi:hypothetical protein
MHVRWTKGGDATLVTLNDDRVTLDSSLSSPPGSLVDGALTTGEAIRVKVRGCKRDGERFRIEGRVIDLSRDLRLKLAALLH